MKILLIDDNERLTQIYQMIINKEGHQTAIELNSENGLERIRTEKPDIVLLDIMMEPLTGWEVLQQIRGDAELSDIPVIILTGKVMTMEEALRYGMQIDGFVMKPLERSMLVTAIEEVWEILTDCEARYTRAIDAGLHEEKAAECRRMIRKRRILTYLKEILERQERIVNLRPDEQSDMKDSIEELRKMIETEYKGFAQGEISCP
ncbi:MAG: response regulator [Methanobacteriota archaeon]